LATVALELLTLGSVVETGELLLEMQVHQAGGPIPVLGYHDLRLPLQAVPFLIYGALVHLRSVDEQHHVGILLDGS
jgi:hypothetical protein